MQPIEIEEMQIIGAIPFILKIYIIICYQKYAFYPLYFLCSIVEQIDVKCVGIPIYLTSIYPAVGYKVDKIRIMNVIIFFCE